MTDASGIGDDLPLAAAAFQKFANRGVEVSAHAATIAKLCANGKQDFATGGQQTELMAGKPINTIVAEALAFYMAGRFNNIQLAQRSRVAEGTIRNLLSPDKRQAGKSGKEPSGKLTELAMLADALNVPMAELVTDMPDSERLDRWTRRAADYYVQHRVMPDWAPPAAGDQGKPSRLAA